MTPAGLTVLTVSSDVRAALQAGFGHRHGEAGPEGSDPTYVPTGDPDLIPIGPLGDELLQRLQPLYEEWTGVRLVPAAAYGMRVYRAGQTMRRHCDRLETHAIGSTILVDSELDEPWPLTIEDHDGKPHEVALEPGQMVMYESAKCPHSRPRPMNGRHYCTLFLHYKPATGWDYTLDRLVEPTTTAQR